MTQSVAVRKNGDLLLSEAIPPGAARREGTPCTTFHARPDTGSRNWYQQRCAVAHTNRCGNSVQPLEKCRCSCQGSLHGSAQTPSNTADYAPSSLEAVQDARDATPAGQTALLESIRQASDTNSPDVDPLRTRLYRARIKAMESEQAGVDPQRNFASALADLKEPDGGFTIDPRTGAAEAAGFFVSVHPEHEKAIPVEEVSLANLNRYVIDKAAILEEDGNFLGGWHDPETGVVSLDVSSKTESAEEARELALRHAQVAFFDAQTFDSVEVDTAQRDRIAEINERNENND